MLTFSAVSNSEDPGGRNLREVTCLVYFILSHHSGFSVACECNEEEINDDDDEPEGSYLRPIDGCITQL